MKILICISVVPDTTTKIKLNPDNSGIVTSDIQWIINPWDELSLTRALELKESPGSGIEKVSVATVGKSDVEPVIRKALAVGADEAFRIDIAPDNAFTTAWELAQFIKENPFDLIFCGIESSDYNGSMVGGMLAEFLDIPSISSVSGIELSNSEFVFKREIEGGNQKITSKLPLVAIVQKGIALVPRIPAMRGIMQARTKPLTAFQAKKTELPVQEIGFSLPPAKSACKMIDPENAGDLIQLLHNEAKVI